MKPLGLDSIQRAVLTSLGNIVYDVKPFGSEAEHKSLKITYFFYCFAEHTVLLSLV
jgi:hypothetical protein